MLWVCDLPKLLVDAADCGEITSLAFDMANAGDEEKGRNKGATEAAGWCWGYMIYFGCLALDPTSAGSASCSLFPLWDHFSFHHRLEILWTTQFPLSRPQASALASSRRKSSRPQRLAGRSSGRRPTHGGHYVRYTRLAADGTRRLGQEPPPEPKEEAYDGRSLAEVRAICASPTHSLTRFRRNSPQTE